MNASVKLICALTMIFGAAWLLLADYPDKETTQRSITNVPSVAMPGYLSPIIDPTFETTVTRISDSTAMGTTDTVIKHFYAKNQPWNCNGLLTRLHYNNVWLLDGNTYQLAAGVMNQPVSNGYSGIPGGSVWSVSDPYVIYSVLSHKGLYGSGDNTIPVYLAAINVQTGARSLVHDFSAGYTSVSFGESEGNLSNDGRYVALQCKNGTATYALIYDFTTDNVVSTLDLQGQWPDWVSVSQSGIYVVICWSGNVGTDWNDGIQVYDLDLDPAGRRQISTYYGHGDLGYDNDGHEVFVFTSSANWDIIGCRLDGGGTAVYLDSTLCGIQGRVHVSCRNTLRPGWCYISDYDYNYSSLTASFEHNEVFALKMDGNYGSPTLERFAHSHSPGYNVTGYMGSPMAVPSHDGTKVMFGNVWDGDATSPIYAYVTEKKGGNQIIRMSSAVTNQQRYARQTISITGDTTGSRSFTVSGKSKAENVSGSNHNDYSLYCDVAYTDGSYLYGQCAQFNTGNHDWENASRTITPATNKIVSSITLYCMFRNKSGNVWFDDVSLVKSTAPSTNLVQNPGFTTGNSVPLTNWTSSTLPYGLDQTSQAIKMSSAVTTEQRYARQTVNFNRAVGTITVSGKSKAQDVAGGSKDVNYSIYCDVIYTDGTYLWGGGPRCAPFGLGTHDWEIAAYTFTPDPNKTVNYINFYCHFKNKSGTVWFEDMRMTESNKEPNLLSNPDFNTGTAVPIANWSSSSLQYTLSNK